jgi:acyl-CoA thioester hydrolase
MNNKLIYEEKIYTYHIDFVGHVNNLVYIQWMENGRLRLLEAIGFPPTSIKDKEGIFPILVQTSIKYKKPLFLDNKVKVELWISKLNNASAILEFNFWNEKGELCATAQQKGLFIDRKTQRPQRLGNKFRIAFEEFLLHNNRTS